jgi:uncharacterized protein HemY
VDRTRADDFLERGRRALTRAAWAEARDAFSAALEYAEAPEAYEGLGIAARYELDGEAAIAVHEAG